MSHYLPLSVFLLRVTRRTHCSRLQAAPFCLPIHPFYHRLFRLKVGITDGFVRVSCGVEDTEDLLAALKKGLDDL